MPSFGASYAFVRKYWKSGGWGDSRAGRVGPKSVDGGSLHERLSPASRLKHRSLPPAGQRRLGARDRQSRPGRPAGLAGQLRRNSASTSPVQ